MIRKLLLGRLMMEHNLSMVELADASQIGHAIIYEMIGGTIMRREDFEQVLFGLNALCNSHYALDDISQSFHYELACQDHDQNFTNG